MVCALCVAWAAASASSRAGWKTRLGGIGSVIAQLLAARGLVAIRAAAHVEMEMVVMIGVAVGREADREAPAAAAVDLAQEAADPLVLAVPAFADGDVAAVGEQEARDVDRIGAAMFGEALSRPAVDRPAGIGSERLDPRDPA